MTTDIKGDFFEYLHGDWLKKTKIPNEYTRWGTFEILHDENLNKLHKLIKNSNEHLKKRKLSVNSKITDFNEMIGILYSQGMNTRKINSQGLESLNKYISLVDSILESRDNFIDIYSQLHMIGVNCFFAPYVSSDAKESSMNRFHLYHSGLGLPDRDYYLKDDNKKILDEYRKYLTNFFKIIGEEDEEQCAENVITFETELAKNTMTRVERRDPKKTYNPTTLDKLDKEYPHFCFNKYVDNLGVKPEKIIIDNPRYYKEVNKMIKNGPLSNLHCYLKFKLINEFSSYLTNEMYNNFFEFYGKKLRGQKKMKQRWKRVVGTVDSLLDEVVGQIYVKEYFSPKAKSQLEKMVLQFKKELENIIKNSKWMTEKTKKNALLKLEKMKYKIGYPNKWKDYSGLELFNDSYVENIIRCNIFEFKKDLDKLDKPIDLEEWEMSPQTINAYYHPERNEIVFPAAILQPPFFDINDNDQIQNYGAIGSVIGHEMTHGFDDQGRQYDHNGNLNDWWEKSDVEKFNKEAQNIIDQFNSFIICGKNVNGELTQGENIADVGGIKISLNALIHNSKKKLTQSQYEKFFESYAVAWKSKITEQEQLRLLQVDPHSPCRLRVNGALSNIGEFYETYKIGKDDNMYLPPKKRCKIW